MKLNRHSWKPSNLQPPPAGVPPVLAARGLGGPRFPKSQNGVALVVTVILITVITFMAITFLILSRREKNSVTTATDQNVAQFAAQAALDRAKAEIIAPILATTNALNFDLLVSTNFVNWNGFDPAALDYRTNVNFEYRVGGAALTANDALQNLTNLVYSPRAPVFVLTNRATGAREFRFYHDLNRNGQYDRSGFWPAIGPSGGYLYPDGTEGKDPSLAVTNFFIGDPEWIGILARPDLPHSPLNQFVARYAFFVVPSGKTLDVNYVHNQAFDPAKTALEVSGEDFYRNQGVGSWEINLAAFLYDLNTNLYAWGGNYFYNPMLGFPASGNAFVDAGEIYRYRLNGRRTGLAAVDYAYNVNGLFSANATLGAPGNFGFDFVDGYSAGPLMVNYRGLAIDNDGPRMSQPWSGSANSNHVFTTQDFFDSGKASAGFVNRLTFTGSQSNSYDRYTYYRMLAQLGTDSPPEQDKINLNYKNIGGVSATNFIPWTPEDFFTNAADKMIRRFTADWQTSDPGTFVNTFATNRAFGLANIPVVLSNRFVYTPSINRLLQLAANMYDASTNRAYHATVDFPDVFRPIFRRQGNDVFITGYQPVHNTTGWSDPVFTIPLDLNDAVDFQRVPPSTQAVDPSGASEVNVYGVPWIIGAKKGFPNFNEFAASSTFELTRKLEIQRSSATQKGMNGTMRMKYVLSLTNVIGMELWNSYTNHFDRPLDIAVQHEMRMVLTNDQPGFVPVVLNTPTPVARTFTLPANIWRGYNPNNFPPNPLGTTNSLFVPLLTNVPFLPEATYVMATRTLVQNQNLPFEDGQGFPFPRWGFNSTNRVRVIMRDTATGRVIDYVQLNSLDGTRDLTQEILTGAYSTANSDPIIGRNITRWREGMWNTNRLPTIMVPYQGITNQLLASIGAYGNPPEGQWEDYGRIPVGSGGSVQDAINNFRLFYLGLPGFTNLQVQVPFTPTARYKQDLTWQANDPLVHYMPGDMMDIVKSGTNGVAPHSLKLPLPMPKNIGALNVRYKPWGGNPQLQADPAAYDVALKDPDVRSSDAWEFSTNKFPNVGWLGRVHRGSPWQTVYLKSSDVAKPADWQNWTGNERVADAQRNRPVRDRMLFDLFTTAFNDNAARGQLPVNQTNLAAWSAVLSGVVALSNSSFFATQPSVVFRPIEPAGVSGTNGPLARIVDGIVRIHSDTNLFPSGTFRQTGDILAVPELTERSPFINKDRYFTNGLNDAVYEWLPQQIMSLLRLGEPRFVVYAYGQTLRPAPRSIVTSGNLSGLCTNYQITAEVATRAVMRVEGAPTNSHVVVENYNILPPD